MQECATTTPCATTRRASARTTPAARAGLASVLAISPRPRRTARRVRRRARRRNLLSLARQATSHGGRVGKGSAGRRWASIPLGRRAAVTRARLPGPLRRGDASRRRLAIRRSRPRGERRRVGVRSLSPELLHDVGVPRPRRLLGPPPGAAPGLLEAHLQNRPSSGTFKDDPSDLRATARTPEARDGGRPSWLYEEVGFRCAKGVTPRRLRERGR